MKHFLRTLLAFVLMMPLWNQVRSQSIILDFVNEKLSADKKQWTFDLMAKGDPAYDGAENGLWIAFNIRMDVELPAGVNILGGSGIGDPTYASASIAVQNLIPGTPPAGQKGLGLTLERSDANQDLNTSNFVKIASYTINFSDEVPIGILAHPRTSTDEIEGSSWVNSANENLYRPFIFADVALPVKLVTFSADREGNAAQLAWSTSEESNSAYFEVQRSADGKKWDEVANVPAKGESRSLEYYTAVDKNPLSGKNLYRLKMVDIDGSSALSRIQAVEFDTKYAFFPNPVGDELTVNAENWNAVKRVSIYDVKGAEVYRSPLSPEKHINVRGLLGGTYVLKVTTDDAQELTHRIVIAK